MDDDEEGAFQPEEVKAIVEKVLPTVPAVATALANAPTLTHRCGAAGVQ